VFAAATVAAAFVAAGRVDSAAPLALGLGAVLAIPLLAVPATGRPRPAHARPLFAVAAAAAAIGTSAAWMLTAPVPTAPRSVATDASRTAPAATRPSWTGFTAALERADAERRPVFVAFVTAWCGYCKKMDQVTWRDPNALARLERVVPVLVDAEDGRTRDGVSGVELARRYDVSGYPTLLVLDAGGRVLSRAGGYLSPSQFARWLDEALERFDASPGRIQAAVPVS
jgi:thiol:disulfide interchange protein